MLGILGDALSNRLNRAAMPNLPCTSSIRRESGLFQHRLIGAVDDHVYNMVIVGYHALKAKNKFLP